jgi:hypothetical protein
MNSQKKAELATFLIKNKGILLPEDQDAEIKKMSAQCPEATATEKGLVDEVDRAYEVMIIMNGTAGDPTGTQVPVATQPTSIISAAEELQISKTLLKQGQERAAVSANTTIDSYVFDRPDPATVIKAGTKGQIVEKSWKSFQEKIDKGTYVVLPDDGADVEEGKRIASTTNYNALKAAFEAGSPVDVYIGGLNKKPIGYIVVKGSATGAGNAPVQMTREQLEQFTIMETAGYIVASETKPGVKLKYMNAKADPTNPGKSIPGKTILADANKKAAVEAGSYDVSREATSEVVSTGCKSALQIRVKMPSKTAKDGVTPLTKTVRISLKADLPTLTRKAKYVDVFGTGERESNSDLINVPTGEQAKKISEAQRNAIATLRQKANDPATVGDLAAIADKLAAFDAPASQAPGAVL